jgi:hypothetical protein
MSDKIKKRGPPFKLEVNESLINSIELMAACGLTLEDISLKLKISEASVYNYKDKFPIIAEAIKRGRADGKELSSHALLKKVKEGDISAIKWYEQTRHGFSEKIKTENEHVLRYEPLELFLKRTKEEKEVREIEDAKINKENERLELSDSDASDSIVGDSDNTDV